MAFRINHQYLQRNACLIVVLLLLLPCASACAQTSTTYFFPEFDAYIHLNSNIRFVFQAKGSLEGGDFARAEIGPSMQFYLKPWMRLKKVTAFEMDEAKSRPLMLIIGYRYLPSPSTPTMNRIEPVAMFHFPVKGRMLITDRNRADLDWSNGTFNWRYRNRITAERRLTIHAYHPGPYASAEFFYESQYAKWSSTRLYAGCLLPLSKHVELDPYYEHENNTGKSPDQQVNAAGLILNVYFLAAEK